MVMLGVAQTIELQQNTNTCFRCRREATYSVKTQLALTWELAHSLNHSLLLYKLNYLSC